MTARRAARQWLAVGALALAGAASIATSPPPPKGIVGPPVSGSFVVDAEHVVVSQRIVVTVNDAAAAGDGRAAVSIGASVTGGIGRTGATGATGRTVVTGATGVDVLAVPGPGSSSYQPGGTGGAVDIASNGGTSFQFSCDAGCERTYKIVGRWRGAGSYTVSWQATDLLEFSGNWPAGASISASADPPIAESGEGRTLSASLGDQRITVDATHPVAARVIEIRLAAAAVARSGDSLITTARLDQTIPKAVPPRSAYYTVAAADTNLTLLTPLTGYGPQPVQAQFDPFVACRAGEDCVRRYALTAVWNGAQPATVEWGLEVVQLRARADRAAPDALQVSVVASYDVSPAAPTRQHFEGDVRLAPGTSTGWRQVVLPFDVTAPPGDVYAFLPAPVTAHLEAAASGPGVYPGLEIDASPVPAWAQSLQPQASLQWAPFGLAGPTWSQPPRIAVTMTLSTSPTLSPPPRPVTVHWSLDLSLFSYVKVPPFAVTSPGPTVATGP